MRLPGRTVHDTFARGGLTQPADRLHTAGAARVGCRQTAYDDLAGKIGRPSSFSLSVRLDGLGWCHCSSDAVTFVAFGGRDLVAAGPHRPSGIIKVAPAYMKPGRDPALRTLRRGPYCVSLERDGSKTACEAAPFADIHAPRSTP